MKRKLAVVLILSSIFLLSGCTSVIELSDDENRAIAEYSAELLLKYSIRYNSKYFEGEQELEESLYTEEDTEAVTELTTTEPEETTDTAAVEPDADTEQTVDYETDIAKVIGLADCSVLFSNYQILDRYPSEEQDGAYVEAPSGMKLLVVSFDVKNLSEEPVDVNLLNMDVDYRIIMNQSRSAKSMLTILMNDLSTYEATLAPGVKESAVLVFQISDELVEQIQSLDIKITYESIEKLMKVL